MLWTTIVQTVEDQVVFKKENSHTGVHLTDLQDLMMIDNKDQALVREVIF